MRLLKRIWNWLFGETEEPYVKPPETRAPISTEEPEGEYKKPRPTGFKFGDPLG